MDNNVLQQAPVILNTIQETVDKADAVVNQIKDNVASANLKQTVITNQQKTQFLNYAGQLYTILDESVNNIPPINLLGSVIVQLEAISEKYVQGKKLGAVRQDLVFSECVNYLQNRNVAVDDTHKVLIRGLIETTFLYYENRLLKIFDDVFQVTTGCLSGCAQMSSVLTGIIPKAV